MEYLLIIALQFIGIGLHVAQKVMELDKKFEDDSFGDVLNAFWKQDKFTLLVSLLVLALNLLTHFILAAYSDIPASLDNYLLYSFGISLVLGYAGQRLIYKGLGKAEEALTKRVEERVK